MCFDFLLCWFSGNKVDARAVNERENLFPSTTAATLIHNVELLYILYRRVQQKVALLCSTVIGRNSGNFKWPPSLMRSRAWNKSRCKIIRYSIIINSIIRIRGLNSSLSFENQRCTKGENDDWKIQVSSRCCIQRITSCVIPQQ